MERKPELRLPTTAVPVTLWLAGGVNIDAELFVGEMARTGHSQLLDDVATMLDETASFLPVRVERAIQLYAKRAILVVSVVRRDDDKDKDDGGDEFDDVPSEVFSLYDRQHHVKVELAGERSLSGMLFDSSPSDRPRVIDHLNGGGRFLRLWTEGTHYLINKDQIIRVSEQEPT
ncbi:MAG TPA: hypothetical protein VMZ53_18275 [Kofleriaceae bacterium]|nr:hypothetical protein [Kofleriaceae bacterium]